MLKKIKITDFAVIVILVSIILPVLIGCLYVIPSADDFTNSLGWQSYEGNHFKYIFVNLAQIYNTWQGTYVGILILGFPIYYITGIIGLRFFLLFVTIFFFISIFVFSRAIVGTLTTEAKQKRSLTLLFATMMIGYVVFTNNLDEIFYWYTGAGVYTLPLCFYFVCVAFFIFYNLKQKKTYLVIGIVFAALSAGGALDIAALLCVSLLFAILYDVIVLRTIKKNIIIGAVALLGSIINAVAPGNFVRHDFIDSNIRPMMSLFNTVLRVNTVITTEFKSGFLLLIIIVSFVVAYNRYKKTNKLFKYPGLVSCYCYMGMLITDFPVVLGYSGRYMPGRCIFVEHVSILVFVILLSSYWAGWAAQKKIFEFTKDTYLILAVICIIPLSTYFGLQDFFELTPYKMVWHIAIGDFEETADREQSIIEQIEKSSERDVVIYINYPEEKSWTNIKTIGLTEDSTNWINAGVSDYYGKNTITIQYVE